MCRMVDHLFGAVVRQGHPAQLKRWDVGGVSRIDHLFGAVGGGGTTRTCRSLSRSSRSIDFSTRAAASAFASRLASRRSTFFLIPTSFGLQPSPSHQRSEIYVATPWPLAGESACCYWNC